MMIQRAWVGLLLVIQHNFHTFNLDTGILKCLNYLRYICSILWGRYW